MSMLRASDRMTKSLFIAMAVAGGGVMLYYGYTKLKPKSKKSPGPPATRKRPSSYKGAASDPLQEAGKGDAAKQEHAPCTEHAEESIVQEGQRPTCEIKPKDEAKLDAEPVPDAAVAASLSESSFERVYLTTQAQQQGEEAASPQPENLAESFEKISLSQVEIDLQRQKLESDDTQPPQLESADPAQQSCEESADAVQQPPVESAAAPQRQEEAADTVQQSLQESADAVQQSLLESADVVQQSLLESADSVQQSLLESADAAQQSLLESAGAAQPSLLESADSVQQSLLESTNVAQQLLQSSAYEKLSLSECQSAGELTSDEDKRSDNDSSGPGSTEATQVGQAHRPAASSTPLAQDVHSSLGASYTDV